MLSSELLRRSIATLILLTLFLRPSIAAPSSPPPFGVNLEGLSDWMRTPMFVDAMKTSRRFGSPDKPWDGSATLGEHGNPVGDFGVVVFADNIHIDGIYRLAFDGKADVSAVSSPADVRNVHYDGRRTTAEVDVHAGASNLFLAFRNTQNVRNIRLIRPGYPVDTHQVFTDTFLKAIKPYRALRLMDYLSTNGNPVVHWSDRTLPIDAQYANGKGGPWEPVIALANAAGKDLWINIPDQADDDYVRRLAALFKSTLAPGRHVYVEYSNEVWNGSFPQAGRNKDEAKREAVDAKSPLNVSIGPDDDPRNETYRAWKRVAERLLQIRRIWLDVYGKARFDATVRPVLASQIGWPFVLEEQVGFIDKVYGPPSRYIYAVAGAPYYNTGGEESKNNLTKDDVLKALDRSVDDYAGHGLDVYASLAAEYHVKLLAYEGGVDIGQGDRSLDARLASQMDPRMRAITRRYLDAWYRHGGGLFMYFTLCSAWNKWGAWGLTDDLTKSTPKTEGVADVLDAPSPAVDAGIHVPGTITGSDDALMRWGTYKSPHPNGEVGRLGADDIRDYLVNVGQAGPSTIRIDLTQPSTAVIEVAVDGVQAKITGTGQMLTAVLGRLTDGLHTLHIAVKSGSVDVKDIVWSR